MSIMLRAAPGAREAIPVRVMATPVRAFKYTDRWTGQTEVIEPGVSFFALDHETVRRHAEMFRHQSRSFSPRGRREEIEALKRELRDIQRQRAALARNTRTRTTRRTAAAPWRLAEPRTRTTGRI